MIPFDDSTFYCIHAICRENPRPRIYRLIPAVASTLTIIESAKPLLNINEFSL
ncbi:MAG TPA: hypothetical protein PKE57_03725 [Cellvibrionaceae bacterium]|nr:hypothetical protein [Cellvibrionaceae bacterium]